MNYIDLIIVALVAWSAYRGLTRGLVIMIASFIALVLGIWGAIRFSGAVTARLAEIMDSSAPYMNLVAFTITFVGIVLIINLAAYLVSRLLDAIALGIFNRLLGSLFGVFKMALILSVFFVILNAFNERHDFLPEEQIESSLLYQPVADLAPNLFPFLRFENIAGQIEKLLGCDCKKDRIHLLKGRTLPDQNLDNICTQIISRTIATGYTVA